MMQTPQGPAPKGSAGPGEYLILGATVWASTWIEQAMVPLLRGTILALITAGVCLAYALLKPVVASRLSGDRTPSLTVRQRLALLQKDAFCLLLGGGPAFVFLVWSLTWLPEGETGTLSAIAVFIAAVALYVGGYGLASNLYRLLRTPKRTEPNKPEGEV